MDKLEWYREAYSSRLLTESLGVRELFLFLVPEGIHSPPKGRYLFQQHSRRNTI